MSLLHILHLFFAICVSHASHMFTFFSMCMLLYYFILYIFTRSLFLFFYCFSARFFAKICRDLQTKISGVLFELLFAILPPIFVYTHIWKGFNFILTYFILFGVFIIFIFFKREIPLSFSWVRQPLYYSFCFASIL